MQCYSQQEIANVVSVTQKTASSLVKRYSGTILLKSSKTAANFEDAYKPPLYNVWKTQNKSNEVSHFGLGRFFRSNPVFLFITATPDDSVESIDIVGNLCTSADCFGQNVEAPRLSEGDLVVISNAGAYCQTTALWGFNSQSLFEEAMLMGDGTLKMLLAQHCL